MAKRYPQALREQIVQEFHPGRSTRALANDYEPIKRIGGEMVENPNGTAFQHRSERLGAIGMDVPADEFVICLN